MAELRGIIPEMLLAFLCAVVLLSNPGNAQNRPTQIALIGGECGGNKLCPDHATCTGTCQCETNYVGSQDSKVCLQEVDHWEGSCTEDIQCNRFDRAVCVGNICDCSQDFHFLDGSCWTTRHLKDECNNDNECLLEIHTDRIECRDNICECKEDYTISDSGDQCNGGNKLWSLGLVSLLLAVSIKHILS